MTPSGTQPIQKEPLSPVESTNTLQPNRPPRDQASRENRATTASPVISNRTINNSENNYTPNKTVASSRKAPAITTNKKVTPASAVVYNKTINKNTPINTVVTYKKVPSATTNKTSTVVKPAATKKAVSKKKPR